MAKMARNIGAESSNTPVSEFFKPYTAYDFHYNLSEPASREFKRLCRHMKWQPPSRGTQPPLAARIARHQFGQALIQQFQDSFGDDVDSLDSWQALCAAVYIDPVPETLEEAQMAFERTHVNLLDLTEKRPIKIFPTVQELSDYTIGTGRFFPREDAKDLGSLLSRLLRHIFNPKADDESLKRGGRCWRGDHGWRAGARARRRATGKDA